MFSGHAGRPRVDSEQQPPLEAEQPQAHKIFCDTGSSHCFVHSDIAKDFPETGKCYDVTLAKQGTSLHRVPEVRISIQMGDYKAEWKALKVPLPYDIGVILGMDWMRFQDAWLLTRSGQMSFMDSLTGQLHILQAPSEEQGLQGC